MQNIAFAKSTLKIIMFFWAKNPENPYHLRHYPYIPYNPYNLLVKIKNPYNKYILATLHESQKWDIMSSLK